MEERSNGYGDRRHDPVLDELGPTIPLPSMEPSPADCYQDPSGTSQRDSDHPVVAVCDLVPDASLNSAATPSDDPSSPSAPARRSLSKRPLRESALVAECMEHKIRRIEEAGASTTATELIMSANPKRYIRYAQTQAKYFAWCQEQGVEPMDPSGVNVVNFLAEGHARLNWSLQTIATYRSAILDLFSNRDTIRESFAHKSFMQAVQDKSIRAEQSRPVDITPILTHFRALGPNDALSIPELTTKLCWLLGVCGFLRPSDIERIDLAQCDWTSFDDRILLKVVAPKEKRLGQRITKSVTIQRHQEVHCCPVDAFRTYHRRMAYRPCSFPHPALPHVSLHYLLRDVRDCHRPIYAQRISNHINSVMQLLPTARGGKRLKARALGATRAVLAGASVDDVVMHGGWASRAIFDSFYRLSTETSTNFSSLSLATTPSEVQSLEPQSLDPRNEV